MINPVATGSAGLPGTRRGPAAATPPQAASPQHARPLAIAGTASAPSTVSTHSAWRRGCRLVARERRGREIFYRPINEVPDVRETSDPIHARAAETVGARPRYRSGRAAV